MKMDQETWSKSLLSAYKILPMLTKIIDRSNLSKALGSFSYAGNTMDIVRGILNNNRRKEILINAKVIVDNALASIKPAYRRILELKYLRKMKSEDIAKEEGMSLRNVFRRQALALEAFSKYCIAKGYDCEWLEKRYAKEPVFAKLGERLSAKSESGQPVKTLPKTAKDVANVLRFAPGLMGSENQDYNHYA